MTALKFEDVKKIRSLNNKKQTNIKSKAGFKAYAQYTMLIISLFASGFKKHISKLKKPKIDLNYGKKVEKWNQIAGFLTLLIRQKLSNRKRNTKFSRKNN